MSAIAGLVAFGQETVDRQLAEAIARPPFGNEAHSVRFWQNKGIGFSTALALTAPECSAERQPLVHPASGCAITFDGRIDNLEDLLRSVENELHQLRSSCDAAYALAAYLHWGKDFLSKIIGDFAFAIWNPRSTELTLARDPMGQRTLFYSPLPDGLIFASTLEQLLQAPGIPHDWDEDALPRYMYQLGSLKQQTPYRSIKSLQGGHMLQANPSRTRVERYWRLPADPPALRDLDDEDLAEFSDLFAQAVRCRLRSSAPVGLLLSGGLDSNAIACMAGHLQLGSHLRTFSSVYDRFHACDERPYLQATLDRYSLNHTLLPADHCLPMSHFKTWLPAFSEPHLLPFGASILQALECAQGQGVRAVLMGHGADSLLTGSPRYLADWLFTGRFRGVHRQVQYYSAATGHRYLGGLLVNALLPYMPRRLREPVEYRRWPDARPIVPPLWQARGVHNRPKLYYGKNAWWFAFRDGINLGQTPNEAVLDRMARLYGIELRQPFLDVRLIEFVLRLPPQAGYFNGTTKHLLRASLTNILPDVVRGRKDKTSLQPLLDYSLRERFRPFVQILLEDSELERRGYVNPTPWRTAVQNYLDGKVTMYWPYWRGLTLEMWLRYHTGRLPPLGD